MMTDRDYRVIKSIGDHRLLTLSQIQELHFPSYHTCWRRIHDEYRPNKLVSKPFYIEVDSDGRRTGVYRLESAGKKLYKELTGKKYKTPKFHLRHVPHMVEVNWFLIYFGANTFEIEHDIGNVRTDAYFDHIALEVDLSEYETKRQYVSEYEKYKNLYINNKTPDYLIFYSNRAEQIRKWIGEASKPYPLYCKRNMTSVRNLRLHLGR